MKDLPKSMFVKRLLSSLGHEVVDRTQALVFVRTYTTQVCVFVFAYVLLFAPVGAPRSSVTRQQQGSACLTFDWVFGDGVSVEAGAASLPRNLVNNFESALLRPHLQQHNLHPIAASEN